MSLLTIKITECFFIQDQGPDNARDGALQPLGATGLTEVAVLWLAQLHTSPVRQQVCYMRYLSVQLLLFAQEQEPTSRCARGGSGGGRVAGGRKEKEGVVERNWMTAVGVSQRSTRVSGVVKVGQSKMCPTECSGESQSGQLELGWEPMRN